MAALNYLPDGRLLATHGKAMIVLDEAGEVLREYPLEGSGWSAIAPCRDGEHALLSNIWLGIIIKMHLESAKIVATLETEFKAPKRCLAGVAEYPGKA